ncbi:helicase associated domain-containing protein [Gordonia sp. SCSIO 19800]|nr:helicase associated domain-containing protein [Gordonia sp. SCSIO 19800]
MSHLRRYVAVYGSSLVPSNVRQHDIIDDFKIGLWVANRRSDYRDDRLPAERVQRIGRNGRIVTRAVSVNALCRMIIRASLRHQAKRR